MSPCIQPKIAKESPDDHCYEDTDCQCPNYLVVGLLPGSDFYRFHHYRCFGAARKWKRTFDKLSDRCTNRRFQNAGKLDVHERRVSD